MPKVRDTAIDALKGFLVILVVLGHNNASHPFVLEFCHPAVMGMFFMVSGYLLHGKLMLKKRLRGTLLPFLFFPNSAWLGFGCMVLFRMSLYILPVGEGS